MAAIALHEQQEKEIKLNYAQKDKEMKQKLKQELE